MRDLVLRKRMMVKVTARDTIQRTLPVAEHIIDRHQKVLLDLGNAAREKRAKVLCAILLFH